MIRDRSINQVLISIKCRIRNKRPIAIFTNCQSFDQSINQTIDQLIDWSIMITNLQSTNTRIFSVEFMKEKTFNSLRVSLWHPQRSWGDILLFYVSFFSFYFYSSTHFVHAISRNWSDPCWWNYTIIWTAMWSCARDIGMVKNGRRYHGNKKNVKKNPNFKSFVIRGKVLKVYVNVGSGAPRYQQYLEFSKWLPLPWKLDKSLTLTLWENAFKLHFL